MPHTSGSDDCFDSTGVEHMYFNFSPLFPIQAMCNEVNGGLHIYLEYFLSTCDDLSACGTRQTRGRNTEQSPSSSRYSYFRSVNERLCLPFDWKNIHIIILWVQNIIWQAAYGKHDATHLEIVNQICDVLVLWNIKQNQIKHVKNKTCLCVVFLLNSAYTVSCAETVDTFGFVTKAVKLQS